MKRIIAMLLAVVLCIALLPAAASAEEEPRVLDSGSCSHGVNWTFYEGGLLVLSPESNSYTCWLEPGDDVWRKREYPLNGKWYTGKELVADLVIEDNVGIATESMFAGYPWLETVSLPELKGIPARTFRDCIYLEKVTVRGSVGAIGDSAFQGCESLVHFTVNGTVDAIGGSAFSGCENLIAFDAPVLGDIGMAAFADCKSLTRLSPVRGSVGNSVFRGANDMCNRNIYIVSGHSGALGDMRPANITDGRINLCYTGTQKEFERKYVNESGYRVEAYQQIGDHVTWTLEDGVLTINGYGSTIDLLDQSEQPWTNVPGEGSCDDQRDAITKVRVNAGVELGTHMLDYLEEKAEIFYTASGTLGDLTWALGGDTLYVNGSGAIPNLYGQAYPAWTVYAYTFKKLIIGDGVTAVGFAAFSDCQNLRDVQFADSVTRIDGGAFYGCVNLKSLSLPEHLTTIGRNAFTDCKNLKTIYIPASVTSIGPQAFLGTSLENIYFGGTTAEWNALNVSYVDNAFVHMSAIGLPPSIGTVPDESGFADVGKTDWFAQDVSFVSNAGYMVGTSNTQFSPALTTDRAMAVTVLHRIAGTPEAAAAAFQDVESGSWYEQAVNWAAESGVTNGISADRFDPRASLTREQLVTFLYRYAQMNEPDVNTGDATLANFADAKEVSPWVTDAMRWAVAAGIIKGTDKGEINPAGTATRAEFAAMLHRFAQWKQHEILGKEE